MARRIFRTKQDLIRLIDTQMITNKMLSYMIPEFHTKVIVRQGEGKFTIEHIVGNNFKRFPREVGFFILIEMLWKDKNYICRSIKE